METQGSKGVDVHFCDFISSIIILTNLSLREQQRALPTTLYVKETGVNNANL